jgi:hypothetical protein
LDNIVDGFSFGGSETGSDEEDGDAEKKMKVCIIH